MHYSGMMAMRYTAAIEQSMVSIVGSFLLSLVFPMVQYYCLPINERKRELYLVA